MMQVDKFPENFGPHQRYVQSTDSQTIHSEADHSDLAGKANEHV